MLAREDDPVVERVMVAVGNTCWLLQSRRGTEPVRIPSIARIGTALEQLGQMGGVAGEHAVRLCGRFGYLDEVDEIDAAHGFADPIGRPARRDGEPDIEERLG